MSKKKQPLDLTPAEWHALLKASEKPSKEQRDQLAADCQAPVDFTVRVQGHLKVGADAESAASEAPNTTQLVAVLLEKLDEPVRERILNQLPEQFEKRGQKLPEAKQATLDRVEKMLERLRAKVMRKRRGAVSGLFTVTRVASLLLMLCGLARAQFVPPAEAEQLRKLIPDPQLAAEPRLLIWNERSCPKVYQFSINHTGQMGFYDAYYNTSMAKDEYPPEPFGNPNHEFPWGKTAGIDRCPSVRTFKFLLLPVDQSGRQLPIAWHHRPAGDEMHVPSLGYDWVYPIGSLVGEVLTLQSPNLGELPFEMRLRMRLADGWDVDILRPFPTSWHLVEALKIVRPDWQQRADVARLVAHLEADLPLTRTRLVDSNHRSRRAFSATASIDSLPPIDHETVDLLLTRFGFDTALEQTWRGSDCFAPTTDAAYHIVPRHYSASHAGTSRESCQKCHDTVGQHARDFDRGRDWYGHVRGGGGIFSLSLHDPRCIDPTHWGRPALMRNVPGVFERFDATRHVAAYYQRLPE